MSKKYNIFTGIIAIAIILVVVYFAFGKNNNISNQPGTATSTPSVGGENKTALEYKNNQYGFSFELPQSWKGYSVIDDEWEGLAIPATSTEGEKVVASGPLISIRHPDWDYKAPRQDIPIMVFTIQQWNDLKAEKFHIGAAPIGPSEIGRNSRYVFAIPARYNYAFLTGYEEVDQLIKQNTPLKTF